MALREILAKFGFEFDKAKLREVNKEVEGTKDGIASVFKVLAAGAFIAGIKSFVGGIEHLGSSLNDLSEQTGLGTDNIQLFQYVAGTAGVEAEETSAAIRKLGVTLGNAAAGGADQAKAFTELGVKFSDAAGHARSLDDVFPDLIESFGKITDDGKASRLAVDLFGRSGVKLLGFLKQGKAGLEQFRGEFEALGGGMSAEAIKAADEYGDSLVGLDVAFTGLKSLIGAELFPILTDLVGYFTQGVAWLRHISKETELVKGGLIALGLAGVVALTALLAPFAPIIAAVATLTLFFDDLINFVEGNDSVIGAALNGLFGPDTAEKVRGNLNDFGKMIKDFFEDLIREPKKFFDELKKLYEDIQNFQNSSGVADRVSKAVSGGKLDLTDGGITEAILGKGAREAIWGSQATPNGGVAQPSTAETMGKAADSFAEDPIAAIKKTFGEIFAPSPTQELQKTYYQNVPAGQSPSDGKPDEGILDALKFMFSVGSPTAQASIPITAAVPGAPGTAPVNQLTQTVSNTFNLSADTPEAMRDAVVKGTTEGMGNERRNAQVSLESVGGR